MSKKEDKVLFAGAGQKVVLNLPDLDRTAVETILHSPLYAEAEKIEWDAKEVALVLANGYSTNNWDTVSVCRITALNALIAASKGKGKEQKYPETIFANITDGEVTASMQGKFKPWQVVRGGDGRNIKLNIPLESGVFEYALANGKKIDVAGINFDIMVKLDCIPQPVMNAGLADRVYNLQVRTDSSEPSDPIATVLNVKVAEGAEPLSTVARGVLLSLMSAWLNEPENLQKFNVLFSTVLISNMGSGSEEYQWLRATSLSYAYTDSNTVDSCIFGVLCVTNGGSTTGLPNQIPAVKLANEQNALFLINRALFVKYRLLPALPHIFPESKPDDFILDNAGTIINAKNLKLDSVRVGAINYHPKVSTFDICFHSECIETRAVIFTNISPGIKTETTITTRQTLGLGTNDNGEPIMVYKNLADPIVTNTTHKAAGVIVTEAIIVLIGAVVTGIAAAVARKLIALIVGIAVAVIVATVSLVIHLLIESIISKGVKAGMPSVAPMVRVATDQIKWPFCVNDPKTGDFKLTDIKYSDSIALFGDLNITKKYLSVNGTSAFTGEEN